MHIGTIELDPDVPERMRAAVSEVMKEDYLSSLKDEDWLKERPGAKKELQLAEEKIRKNADRIIGNLSGKTKVPAKKKEPEVFELSDDEEEEVKAFKRARPVDEVEETIQSVVAKGASKETAAKVGKAIKCVADHVPIEIRFDPNVTDVTVSDVFEYLK